jgi:EAL domain-containing protein (putative c-di-GMP-specific phosphodiesterase class I)
VSQLRSIGCEYGQGFYFSKPIDLTAAMAFLARAQNSSEALC